MKIKRKELFDILEQKRVFKSRETPDSVIYTNNYHKIVIDRGNIGTRKEPMHMVTTYLYEGNKIETRKVTPAQLFLLQRELFMS